MPIESNVLDRPHNIPEESNVFDGPNNIPEGSNVLHRPNHVQKFKPANTISNRLEHNDNLILAYFI